MTLQDADPNVVGSDYINGNYMRVRGPKSRQGSGLPKSQDTSRKLLTLSSPGRFVEHLVGDGESESLHCHSGLPGNDGQRLLANGVAGEHQGHRHDDERGGKRAGECISRC